MANILPTYNPMVFTAAADVYDNTSLPHGANVQNKPAQRLYVRWITYVPTAAGGTAEVTEGSGGVSLTGGPIVVAANGAPVLIPIEKDVKNIYVKTLSAGLINVYHGV